MLVFKDAAQGRRQEGQARPPHFCSTAFLRFGQTWLSLEEEQMVDQARRLQFPYIYYKFVVH